jgi:hypothetical protein
MLKVESTPKSGFRGRNENLPKCYFVPLILSSLREACLPAGREG